MHDELKRRAPLHPRLQEYVLLYAERDWSLWDDTGRALAEDLANSDQVHEALESLSAYIVNQAMANGDRDTVLAKMARDLAQLRRIAMKGAAAE